MKVLDKGFWDNRYQTNQTGWDVGEITTPLKEYIDQLEDKSLKILIPGAGNSYEAEYLHQKGFENVFILDFSSTACKNFKKRVPSFPIENVICNDFFNLEGDFDLILEQTFFCALDPFLRKNYAKKCSELLNKNGRLAGVMFNFPLTEEGPPFGGSTEDYQQLFTQFFRIDIMEEAHNSIDSRKNKEVFVKMIKK